jgi:lipoate-protein ligase A
VAPLGTATLPTALQKAYRLICGALVLACRDLGVDAELTGGAVNLRLPNPTSTIPCFEAPAGGEVVVAGRKLVGSAMRAHSGCILQHGAILLDWDGRLQAGALGLRDDATLRPHITTLSAELDRPVERAAVADSVARGFEDRLSIRLERDALAASELGRATELAAEAVIRTGARRVP